MEQLAGRKVASQWNGKVTLLAIDIDPENRFGGFLDRFFKVYTFCRTTH